MQHIFHRHLCQPCSHVTPRGRSSTTRAVASAASEQQTSNAVAFASWFRKQVHSMPVDLNPCPQTTTSKTYVQAPGSCRSAALHRLFTATVPRSGYGMITRAPIKEGDTVLQVPKSLFITEDTARSSLLCGDLIKQAQLQEWQALVLQLLCERAAGAKSQWAPYIALLGPQADHPLLWPAQQRAWLAGSPMAVKLEERLAQIRADTELLVAAGANALPLAQQWQQQQQEALVTPGSVAWAANVLLSRAFSLDMSERELSLEADMSYYGSWGEVHRDVLALVPWADLLAHSSTAGESSVLQFNPDTGCAELEAHRSYSPGEEVFDSYGPGLSPSDLLLDYGFVDPANTNQRYEALPSEVLAPAGPRQVVLLSTLDVAQGGPGARLSLGPQGPDLTSLTWLRAAASSDAELVRAGWRVRATGKDVEMACRAMGRLSCPSSRSTEVKVLTALLGFIDRALAAYPGSLQSDREELAASSTPWLRVQVLRALVAEKEALEGSRRVVKGWLQAVEAGQVELEEVYVGILGGPDGDDDGW